VIDSARDPRLAAEEQADEDAVDSLEHVRVRKKRQRHVRVAERKHLQRSAADVDQAAMRELDALGIAGGA